jgi:hypothetical protein
MAGMVNNSIGRRNRALNLGSSSHFAGNAGKMRIAET